MLEIYNKLLNHFGKQNWWPIDWKYHKKNGTDWRVEVILGAILTQNTRWSNVEKALDNLKKKIKLDVQTLANIDENTLAESIKSVSFYRKKAKRIKNFFNYVLNNYKTLDNFFNKDLSTLRKELLKLEGIGEETADVILLYAAEKLSFVVDAYTKRVFTRLGILKGDESYREIKELFESKLPRDLEVYKEFHALIDELAKRYCKKKNPLCNECPLHELCAHRVDK
jgi:endonuclease-3 related protein